MRVAIAGASGLIGRRLVERLQSGGAEVAQLVRPGSPERDGQGASVQRIEWDPSSATIDSSALAGCDAVVHLGGESVFSVRWTAAKKDRILRSRIDSTRLLVDTIRQLDNAPQHFVCASAIGIYGNRGDEILTEESAYGAGYLSEVCQEWEATARLAEAPGTIVSHLRIGLVLSTDGGALASMLPAFRLGFGGKLGSGQQYWSWILLADVVAAIEHVLKTQLAGPVNLVAPHPRTNAEFTAALGTTLRRPTALPVPGWLARGALGEVAEELMLSSCRAVPAQLLASGFQFSEEQLEAALRRLLVN